MVMQHQFKKQIFMFISFFVGFTFSSELDDPICYELQGAPSVVLFGKHLFAASFLVLIFSKKVVFSLAKVKKVATKRILSDPAKFFSCRIKRDLFGKQIAQIQTKKQHNTYNKYY